MRLQSAHCICPVHTPCRQQTRKRPALSSRCLQSTFHRQKKKWRPARWKTSQQSSLGMKNRRLPQYWTSTDHCCISCSQKSQTHCSFQAHRAHTKLIRLLRTGLRRNPCKPAQKWHQMKLSTYLLGIADKISFQLKKMFLLYRQGTLTTRCLNIFQQNNWSSFQDQQHQNLRSISQQCRARTRKPPF